MENVILIVHLILALCLIVVVLLQRSEGGGLGMGGGGGGVMTGRAAATALGKVTWALAIGFIITSLATDIPEPERRLRAIQASMQAGKDLYSSLSPESATLFTAIALRIDTAAYRHEDDRDRRQPLRLKVAQAIDKACAANNAWWGLMTSDIFGCVFPEKDVASALAIPKKLQEQVNATAELTLTIGLAAFPCLKYTPAEVIENARKALAHAFFMGPGGRACYGNRSR